MTYIAFPDYIKREADNAMIPKDSSNRDYVEYVEWITAGNEPTLPPPEPTYVPQEVSRFQAMAALLQANLLDDVETYIADPGTDEIVKLAWKEAIVFKRTSPTVATLQAVLSLSDTDLDNLFITAALIEA